MMKGFLYGQTEYNLFSNTNRLGEYVRLAKESSFDFLSITDRNMHGCYKFYTECVNNNIKPVIGLEYSYITDDQNESKLLLYAKGNLGYKNLLKITTKVNLDKINKLEDIEKYEDLIKIFVFNDSYLERLIKASEYQLLASFFNTIKSHNGYIGISYSNRLDKITFNKQIEKLAMENGIRVLPIHQCRYLRDSDSIVYDALVKIGGGKDLINEYCDYSFDTNPLEDKLIDEIVSSINLSLYNEKITLPKYPNNKNVESNIYLEALCYKGLERRGKKNKQYYDRLAYELFVINKMGYDDYFLIVWDFIKFAKQNDVLVGPGRGSAAGSLVAYCLGITEVDPLEYDLLFERFLNPERVSMPDIDTDFPDDKRDFVIDHVNNLYGKMHVCNISAFGTFQVKSSVRELAKVFNIDASRIDKIIDMVEKYGYDKLLDEYKDDELYNFLFVAKGLEGLPKHISTHAAGIILSDSPLYEIIPLQEGINGLYQSQLEASDLEKIGLLKMDFLGIRNLTMVDGMIKQISGFSYNKLREIPLNDSKTYKVLQNADTLGIFQLESRGIRNVLSKLKPTCFEDLVAVLALYRPGPMDNIDEFIERKHGKKFEYIHSDLEPILKNTYGIIVYQEQIMKIALVFAGYSLGEADVLRRAVSKKDAKLLEGLRSDFVRRSIKKGYSKESANSIFELIYKFANYGFNKSHSVAYALLSYQMAYIKANYFPIFMSNILNNVISNTESLVNYIKYCKNNGLLTLKPNVNISTNRFVYEKNRLFIPFNAITSIGEIVAKQIVEERNKNGLFKDYFDFKKRCNFLSSSVMEALIYSGALDIFGRTKKSMINNSSMQDELFLNYIPDAIKILDEFDFGYLKEMEYKYLGMNIQYTLFTNVTRLYKKYNAGGISGLKEGVPSRIIASFSYIKLIKTKKQENMALGEIEDENNKLSFVIFPRQYKIFEQLIKENKLYIFEGKLRREEDNIKFQFTIDNIINIDD